MNEIIKEFREKFGGGCFTNFGPESDCGGDIEQFILTKLKEERIKTLEEVRGKIQIDFEEHHTIGEKADTVIMEEKYSQYFTEEDAKLTVEKEFAIVEVLEKILKRIDNLINNLKK